MIHIIAELLFQYTSVFDAYSVSEKINDESTSKRNDLVNPKASSSNSVKSNVAKGITTTSLQSQTSSANKNDLNENDPTLPQTSEKSTFNTTIVGLVTATLAGIFGLAIRRKKRN